MSNPFFSLQNHLWGRAVLRQSLSSLLKTSTTLSAIGGMVGFIAYQSAQNIPSASQRGGGGGGGGSSTPHQGGSRKAGRASTAFSSHYSQAGYTGKGRPAAGFMPKIPPFHISFAQKGRDQEHYPYRSHNFPIHIHQFFEKNPALYPQARGYVERSSPHSSGMPRMYSRPRNAPILEENPEIPSLPEDIDRDLLNTAPPLPMDPPEEFLPPDVIPDDLVIPDYSPPIIPIVPLIPVPPKEPAPPSRKGGPKKATPAPPVPDPLRLIIPEKVMAPPPVVPKVAPAPAPLPVVKAPISAPRAIKVKRVKRVRLPIVHAPLPLKAEPMAPPPIVERVEMDLAPPPADPLAMILEAELPPAPEALGIDIAPPLVPVPMDAEAAALAPAPIVERIDMGLAAPDAGPLAMILAEELAPPPPLMAIEPIDVEAAAAPFLPAVNPAPALPVEEDLAPPPAALIAAAPPAEEEVAMAMAPAPMPIAPEPVAAPMPLDIPPPLAIEIPPAEPEAVAAAAAPILPKPAEDAARDLRAARAKKRAAQKAALEKAWKELEELREAGRREREEDQKKIAAYRALLDGIPRKPIAPLPDESKADYDKRVLQMGFDEAKKFLKPQSLALATAHFAAKLNPEAEPKSAPQAPGKENTVVYLLKSPTKEEKKDKTPVKRTSPRSPRRGLALSSPNKSPNEVLKSPARKGLQNGTPNRPKTPLRIHDENWRGEDIIVSR